jgi:hypothetical protein
MVSSRQTHDPEDKDLDLRPPAVLVVGITGHRSISAANDLVNSTRAAMAELLRRIWRTFDEVHERERKYFSNSKPILRVVTMVADGAGLAGAQATGDCGIELACVLPFEITEYLNDFGPASVPLAKKVVSSANTVFTLPGTRDDGPRSYERANEVILANVDILIGLWDGEPARGRAGTGDVIQAAVSSGIPVIAIDPANLASARLLVHNDHNGIDRPVATELKRKEIAVDLRQLVSQIVLPPTGSVMRRGLDDLYSEPTRSFALRFEYPMLLKIFGVSRIRRRLSGVHIPDGYNLRFETQFDQPGFASEQPTLQAKRLQQSMQRIDQLANHYGRLTRSSATSGFLIIILVAFISACIGIIFPTLSGASIIIQMVVNGLVLLDAAFRQRRRWVERWLDYRSVAERLRALRFLHPLGIGDLKPSTAHYSKRQSWADWYVRRSERGLGAPTGNIQQSDIPGIAKRLVNVEIKGQIDYHRAAFRQLGILERRLSFSAHMALAAAIATATILTTAAYFVGGPQNVHWRPIALVALAVFPAATAAFNGIRADADFVHLVERSAITVIALSRIRRTIKASSLNYDRVAVAAIKIASLMGDELSEWRFMLENRRLRQARR